MNLCELFSECRRFVQPKGGEPTTQENPPGSPHAAARRQGESQYPYCLPFLGVIYSM